MNDRSQEGRTESAEESPKGYYRQETPYDPFTAGAAASDDGHEASHGHRHRRRKSRKSWKSIRPRPSPGEERDIDRSLWVGVGCLAIGFVLGFAVRPLLVPSSATRASIPDVEMSPVQPNVSLDDKTKKTRETIKAMNQDVQENAVRRTVDPLPMERLDIKPVKPRLHEDEGLLRLQPPPPPL